MSDKKNDEESRKKNEDMTIDFNLGKLFGNLGKLAEELSNLSEAGVKKEGGFKDRDGNIKGVYGVSIRSAKDGPSFETFGNRIVKKDGERVMESTREPIVDVIRETDGYTLIVEMPGVDESSIVIQVTGDIVQIQGASKNTAYEKELLLDREVSHESMQQSYVNGILSVRVYFKEP